MADHDEKTGRGQPEALAAFAAAARNDGQKPNAVGLDATPETAALPTSSDDKAEAAKKVLREGVMGRDEGAEEAIDALPDRTRDVSRKAGTS